MYVHSTLHSTSPIFISSKPIYKKRKAPIIIHPLILLFHFMYLSQSANSSERVSLTILPDVMFNSFLKGYAMRYTYSYVDL